MKAGWIVAVCACLCANRILGAAINLNNFDIQEPILRVSPAAGQDVDLFGYSVTAHQIETLTPGLPDAAAVMADALAKTRIIIGAPKGTFPGGLNLVDPGMPAASQTGLVFNCPVSPGSCEGVTGGPDTADVDDDDGFSQSRLFDHRPAAQAPLGAGLLIITIEDKTGQFLGSLVLSTGDNLLVCAPRWTSLVVQGSLPFGRCYITDRDLTNLRMLQPCTTGIPGRTTGTSAEGYCTAGTGAVITDDLIAIGAPGYLQLRGTVWYYDYNSTAIGSRVLGSSMTPDATGNLVDVNDIYTGFRVTSGQIANERGAGRANIIASVPRYNQTAGKYGRVNVYDVPSPATMGGDTLLMASAEGEQIGEFFGYSVIVADLDGDNFDDIVVGAPMYSDIDMGRVESGRVYIFRNLRNSTLASTPVILQGLVARGRFGSSLTSLGDVDNDGYDDFAVGAPYTISTGDTGNTGTVFIYYGRGDVSRIAEQEPFEVTADEMVSRVDGLDDLKTFGWSLSGGVDVDANGYNDLVVGAYQSQSVFVIRSIPVADVYVQLEATLPIAGRLNLEGGNVCSFESVDYPCFPLTIRGNYTGEGLTGPLTVSYTLREVVSSVQRLFFAMPDRPNEVSGSLTFTDVGVVVSPAPVINVLVFTLDEISSLDTLRLEIQLEQNFGPERMGDGNQTVASLSGFPRVRQQGDPQLQVTLVTNCGEVCDADLDLMPVDVVFQNRDGSGTVNEFVAGTVGAVDFILEYQNTALQDAINNELNFTIPEIFRTSVISAADCTTDGRDVLCQLQDRLTQRDGVQTVTIQLTVNQTFPITDGQVDVAFTISTLVSRDNNTANNMRTASFTVTAQADIFVTQQFNPNRIVYRQGLTFPTDVNTLDRLGMLDTVLVVTVGNTGPSTIQSAQLTIFFPSESGDTRYLYLFSVTSITSQDTTLMCDDESVINPDDLVIPTVMSGGRRRRSVTNLAHKRRRREAIASLARKPRQTTNPTTELDCTNNLEACVVIRCDIMSLPTSEIRIEIASRVNEAFFTTQDSDFILTAYANVTITSTTQEVDNRQNSAEAEITLTPSLLGDEEDSNVLIHPIIWPIIGGVLLLIVIVTLLYFCGFFRRKKKPEDEIPEGDFDPNKFNVQPVDPKKEVEATTL